MRFGAGTVARPDLEADARHLLVHRVRPLPGRLPGLDDRQGALAEAADHGPARPGLRGGPAAAARRRGLRGAAARAGRGDRQRRLGLRDLRRLRARVPGLDRARRPHRRPAPPPRDDGGALPARGRADAARRRARRQPVGQAADRARRLGRARSACACSSRATRRRRCSTGSAARRRSTSAHGPRRSRRRKLLQAAGVDFAILGPRESCTGDPARRMGNEYLFQAHAEQNVGTLNEAGVTKIVASCPHCFNTLGERVPGLRRRVRGRPPHRAARRAGRARAGSQPTAATRSDHLPRLLLPGPPQRRARGPARAGGGGRSADRDGAQRQAHVLLRRRRRAHVDGGARRADQRGARARGGRRPAPTRSRWPARSAR